MGNTVLTHIDSAITEIEQLLAAGTVTQHGPFTVDFQTSTATAQIVAEGLSLTATISPSRIASFVKQRIEYLADDFADEMDKRFASRATLALNVTGTYIDPNRTDRTLNVESSTSVSVFFDQADTELFPGYTHITTAAGATVPSKTADKMRDRIDVEITRQLAELNDPEVTLVLIDEVERASALLLTLKDLRASKTRLTASHR